MRAWEDAPYVLRAYEEQRFRQVNKEDMAQALPYLERLISLLSQWNNLKVIVFGKKAQSVGV